MDPMLLDFEPMSSGAGWDAGVDLEDLGDDMFTPCHYHFIVAGDKVIRKKKK